MSQCLVLCVLLGSPLFHKMVNVVFKKKFLPYFIFLETNNYYRIYSNRSDSPKGRAMFNHITVQWIHATVQWIHAQPRISFNLTVNLKSRKPDVQQVHSLLNNLTHRTV